MAKSVWFFSGGSGANVWFWVGQDFVTFLLFPQGLLHRNACWHAVHCLILKQNDIALFCLINQPLAIGQDSFFAKKQINCLQN